MKQIDIASLEANVNAVVRQTAELEAAIKSERDQRTALMALVLHTAMPAVRSLTGKIQTYMWSQTALDHWSETESDNKKAKYHPGRGLRLHGYADKAGAVLDRTGQFTGWDTFLLEDGGLLNLKYQGGWAVGESQIAEWDCESITYIMPSDAARHLVDERSDQAAIEAINNAVSRQVSGNSKKRTEEANKRSERVKAILTLTQTR